MGRFGCVRCEKSLCDLTARTFALIAPVHPVLHRVSCSYETLTNAPKHYTTQENLSLGSNGADWERSFRKILTRHRCTNFCINCTSSARFAPSFVQQRNGPKCTRTERNAPKHEFRVQWCGSGAFVAKILTRHHGTNFCINCTSLARFAASLVQQRNGFKCTQIERNAPKHEFRFQQCGLGAFVAKISNMTSWHELLH